MRESIHFVYHKHAKIIIIKIKIMHISTAPYLIILFTAQGAHKSDTNNNNNTHTHTHTHTHTRTHAHTHTRIII